MKHSAYTIFFIALFLLCACTFFDARQSVPEPVAPPEHPAIPVGKNWQIIEEAPKLSDERGRLPFQTEQSVQPGTAKPATPQDNRTLQTPP